MSRTAGPTEFTASPRTPTTPATDLRRAGLGAVIAAASLAAWGPLWILVLSPLLGMRTATDGSRFDPVASANWGAGVYGLLELSVVAGVTVLWLGVRRVAADGWSRDLATTGGILWTTGLALHAASFMVQNTPAQSATWLTVSADAEVRATIGAAVTIVQWGFFALAITGAATWTAAYVVGVRRDGIVGLGTGVPALVIAAAAMVLAVLGIIPPAATFAQLVLLLLVGIPLLVRARRTARKDSTRA